MFRNGRYMTSHSTEWFTLRSWLVVHCWIKQDYWGMIQISPSMWAARKLPLWRKRESCSPYHTLYREGDRRTFAEWTNIIFCWTPTVRLAKKVYIKRNSFCSARCNRFGFSWQRAIRAVFTCDRFVLRAFTRDMFYIFLLVGRWRRGGGEGGRSDTPFHVSPPGRLSYVMAQLLIRSHCTVLFSYHNRHTSLSLSSD